MLINRRGFLGLLGGAVATAVVAPKIYVLPPANGWKQEAQGLLVNASPINFYGVSGCLQLSAIELTMYQTQILELVQKKFSLGKGTITLGERYDSSLYSRMHPQTQRHS